MEFLKESIGQCSGLASFTFFPGKLEWYTPALILTYILYPSWFFIVKKMQMRINSDIMFKMEVLAVISLCYIQSFSFCRHYIVAMWLARIPIILVATFTYFHLQKKEIRKIAFLYVVFAIIPFFMNNESAVMQFCLPLVLFSVSIWKIKIPFESFFAFLGRHSYEIYLSQTLTTKYLMEIDINCNHFILIFAVVMLTPVIACLLYFVHSLFYCALNQIKDGGKM